MKQITNKSRRTGKTSQARSAVRELRKAGYVWADGEWQAHFLTITVPACDEDALRRAFVNNKQGGRLMPYAEKYIRKGLGQIGNPTASAIATAVCQRVAELDDRSSPEDWPEAMLVTQDELQTILTEELAAALPAAPQAQPADALDANPLTSDADCGRLEAEMAIDVCWSSREVSAYARYYSTKQGAHELFRLHGGDKQKARRYAVTRLLSKIQMNKQAQ